MHCSHCDNEFVPNIELEYQPCPCCGKVVRDRDPLEIVWKSGMSGLVIGNTIYFTSNKILSETSMSRDTYFTKNNSQK